MSIQEQIDAMLEVASEQLEKIRAEYDQSLRAKSVSPKLSVYIKNYLENLRSPLDYIASEICVNILSLSTSHRTYFPIACENDTTFTKHMNKYLPNLDTTNATLFSAIQELQSYKSNGCTALPKLSKLVNENKHRQLSTQTKTVSRGLEIKFPGGASISMGPGASISGGGMISSGGGWFSPAGGTISGDSPANMGQNIQQTVTQWVSFSFTETGNEVLSLLEACQSDVEKVVEKVTPLLRT